MTGQFFLFASVQKRSGKVMVWPAIERCRRLCEFRPRRPIFIDRTRPAEPERGVDVAMSVLKAELDARRRYAGIIKELP